MIERWALSNNCNCLFKSAGEGGEFVLYEDHKAIVDELLGALEEALHEIRHGEFTVDGYRRAAEVAKTIDAVIVKAKEEK